MVQLVARGTFVCSGIAFFLGIGDDCTSTGGAFTGGRRKNLILVIFSKSEASCSSVL